MRIIQRYSTTNEEKFLQLEKKFAALERARPDYPKGKRLLPISAQEPCNTLIWEHEFPDIQTAYDALEFLNDDKEHKELYKKQAPYFEKVKIEFYKNFE
ncbi:hypothetical protein BH23BAC3_BH23BAC3_02880 [soil metagenome]